MEPDPRPLAGRGDRRRSNGGGEADKLGRLTESLHGELRRAAARLMRRQRRDHTLQPTALVNEAWLKLSAGGVPATAMNREHLYRAAVLAMRQVLTDHHRRRNRAKRSGRWHQHPVEVALNRVTRDDRIALEALNEALDHLAVVDSRACLVTAFHSFLRMPLGEVAEALGISPSTAERDWHFARVWLRGRLGSELPEA